MKLIAFLFLSITLLSANNIYAQSLVGIDPLNYSAEQRAIFDQMTDEEKENLLDATRVSSPDLSATTSINVAPQGNVSRTAVVADVGLVDLNLRLEENTLSGNFSVISRMGRQNNILYGLTLSDENGKILSGYNLGEVDYLEEGQINTQTIDFKLPPLPAHDGLIKLKLVAETESGLPLSSKIVGEINLPSEVMSKNICTHEEGKIVCEVETDFNGELVFKESLISNVEIARVLVLAAGKSSVEVPLPDSVAGIYFGILQNQNQEIISVFRGKSDNVYAKFRNVLVYENNGFIVVTAPIALTLGKKVNIEYNMIGVGGEVCLQGKEELRSSVFNYIIEKKAGCESGSVMLSLVDQDNNILNKYSNSYSVSKYVKAEESTEIAPVSKAENSPNNISRLALIMIVLLGILIFILTIIRQRRKKDVEESITNNQ